MLGFLLEILGLALCSYVAILLLADLYLILVHLRRSKAELAREAELASGDRTRGAEPKVCVKLPIFNEGRSVAPAIDALCRLDWPHDKLEIMVLDDSTDDTSAIVAERVAHWRAAGLQISALRRAHREEFKAGALAAAIEQTDARFFAIFDVDYRPAPSFLRLTMAALLADPKAAFVQARLDFRNRDRNLLTRAQAIELDTFFAYEQAARNWAGVPMTFNGTCGVWRREAIEQAGGWSGRSLVEDQDLSFRAFAAGWRCRNLVSVSAAGELPESFGVLAVQRTRWGAGTAQAFNDLSWRLLGHLRWHQALIFALLAQFYAAISLLLGAIFAVTATTLLVDAKRGLCVLLAFLAVAVLLVVLKTTGAALATTVQGRRIGIGFLRDIVGMWVMELALLPVVGLALVKGYLKQRLVFDRTPKTGR